MRGKRMKTMVSILMAVGLAPALPASTAETVFQPGDTVRIVVSFKAPVAVIQGRFHFQLIQPAAQEEDRQYLEGATLQQVSEAEYEISGTVPPNAIAGRYRLFWFEVSSRQGTKRYTLSQDFRKDISIEIQSPVRPQFPEVENLDLRPSH